MTLDTIRTRPVAKSTGTQAIVAPDVRKTMKRDEISLAIDVFTPETLPMARLAEYLQQFSELVGSAEHVHFSKVAKGSAICRAFVDPPAMPKVRERIEAVLTGNASKNALRAHSQIDDLLAADNATGGIFIGEEQVIEFPGRRRSAAERIGPVRRSCSIEGQIFSIGGKDDTINVHIRDKQQTYRCEVSIELAKKLAPHFLSGKVRLFGQGDWYRADGRWEVSRFLAVDFTILDNETLPATLANLREAFADVDAADFIPTMEKLRHE